MRNKKSLFIALIFAVTLLFGTCLSYADEAGDSVTEPVIQEQVISGVDMTITIGSKATSLGTTLTTGEGKLSYKSANTKVVSVSTTGKITPKAVGETYITVTAAATENYAKATKKIKVTVAPKGTTLVSISSAKNGQLTVKWKKATSITGYQIRYSKNSNMASARTITVKGTSAVAKTLTGLTKGAKYYVQVGTYKVVNGKKIVSAWSKYKYATTMNASLSATKLNVKKGGSAKLTVKNTAGKKVTWTSSKKSIATVSSSGKIIGKKLGTTTITAKVGSQTLTCKVSVIEIPVISKTKTSVYRGSNTTLKITGTSKKATWTTSNKSVATVSSKGVVTGKKAGTATITAMVAGKKLTCVVTVKNRVSVSQSEVVFDEPGKKTIKVTYVGSGWISIGIKDQKIAKAKFSGGWKGNTTDVVIEALKTGSTYIEFKNELNSEVHRVKVTVKGPWEKVEVIIPETIGDKENTGNRMMITEYSFSEYSDNYYSMKVYFKCVQKMTDTKDWSEYFYCYDKNGKQLKACFMNAASFVVGGTYGGPVTIPKDTAKIVFEEYPYVPLKNPWDDVEVVVPETLGDKENPGNRMELTEYRFGKKNDTEYYMNVYFKCVQKKVDVANWSEYFYCYDKDGNLLKKCWMNGPSFVVGGTYGGPVTIPVNTAKIVFEEYPEPTVPDDPMLWSYDDYLAFKNDINSAYAATQNARNYLSTAIDNKGITSQAYCQVAMQAFAFAEDYYESAYNFAINKKEVGLLDGNGNYAGVLTDRLLKTISYFDVLDGLDYKDDASIDVLLDLSGNLIPENAFYQKILLDMLGAYN